MITKTDLKIQNDSYTKKDFYEIYPELLDIFSNMTNTFDPAASNESDPIIVLLKLLAFSADKLNYNIDKSELENKLPSATQENSVRKICEMLGYDMGYIESAITPVTFMWQSADLPSISEDSSNKSVTLKAFETTITDDSNSVTYTLTEPITFTNRYVEKTVNAIEGSIVTAEINSDNILRIENLDANKRFYLPENSIASNGVFVISNDEKNLQWVKKDNLNIRYYDKETRQVVHTIWKFGYDSSLDKPYIQFNDDINEYIGDGLKILYIRSSGSKGNINANTLTKLVNTELSINETSINDSGQTETTSTTVSSDDVLIIKNLYSTNTGKDKETINEAYSNYKKTINTFDTLVTCMDYANYITLMKKDENIDNSYLVSNCQVSNISNDLNNSLNLATYINTVKYVNVSEKEEVNVEADMLPLDMQKEDLNVREKNAVNVLYQGPKIMVKIKQASMDNFDLFIYPLNPINTSYTAETYQKSFKPITNCTTINEILDNLEDTKCISHKIKQGGQNTTDENLNNDLYLIKNYYSLNAKINTKNKVNSYEILDIKNNIYNSLYENFNAHELEYGEEIPYDLLLEVITNSDTRIKAVSLDEPTLETRYMLADGTEGILSNTSNSETDRTIYRKLVLKNVLAGRVPLFNYVNKLSLAYNETNTSGEENGKIYGSENTYYEPTINSETGEIAQGYEPSTEDLQGKSLTAISTNLTLDASQLTYESGNNDSKYTLRENESIIISKPKFVTTDTYSSYVSYYLKKNSESADMDNKKSNICKLKPLDKLALTEYYGEGQSKTIQNLVEDLAKSKSVNIYRRSSTNDLSSIKGYLVDDDLYSYVLCGSKVGSFYQTTWTYNKNTNYFIDSSVKGDLIYDLYSYDTASKTYSFVQEKEWSNAGVSIEGNIIKENGKEVNWDAESLQKANVYTFTHNNTNYELRRYTCGSTPDYSEDCIKANTEYLLGDNEALYISLVDSDNVDHAYKYYKNSNNKFIVEDNGIEVSGSNFSGIICPNFDLYPSEVYAKMGTGHSYSKTSNSTYGTYYIDAKKGVSEIPGMFALGTSEELAIKGYTKAKMTEQCYLYWLSNNNNKLTFNKIAFSEEQNIGQYECILNEDEYLWYTNSAKTNMVTLGYGTKLTLTASGNKEDSTIIWDRQTSENITLSDISKNGIGAFSSGDWILRNFNSSNFMLETEQMELTTLNEGIEIIGIKLKEDTETTTTINSTKWTKIEVIKYRTKDSKTVELSLNSSLGSDSTYRIKTLLNLNIGPSIVQTLSDSSNSDPISKQDIQLFTSYWCTKDSTGYKVVKADSIRNELTYNKSNLYEYIINKPLNITTRDGSETSFFNEDLKSNYLINQTGGIKVALHTIDLNGTNTDNIEIYPVKKESSIIHSANDSETNFEENKTINLVNVKIEGQETLIKNYILLNTFTLKNTYGIFSIYVVNIDADNIKLETVAETENLNNLIKVEDYLKGQDVRIWQDNLILKNGLNTIVVKEGCKLKLSCENSCTVKVLNYKLISAENNSLNLSYLGINENDISTFSNELVNKVSNLDNDFYYDLDIDNSKYIDVSSLDNPYAWFNVNNLFSQFTLAELDVNSFTNIDISRSSRLN